MAYGDMCCIQVLCNHVRGDFHAVFEHVSLRNRFRDIEPIDAESLITTTVVSHEVARRQERTVAFFTIAGVTKLASTGVRSFASHCAGCIRIALVQLLILTIISRVAREAVAVITVLTDAVARSGTSGSARGNRRTAAVVSIIAKVNHKACLAVARIAINAMASGHAWSHHRALAAFDSATTVIFFARVDSTTIAYTAIALITVLAQTIVMARKSDTA